MSRGFNNGFTVQWGGNGVTNYQYFYYPISFQVFGTPVIVGHTNERVDWFLLLVSGYIDRYGFMVTASTLNVSLGFTWIAIGY